MEQPAAALSATPASMHLERPAGALARILRRVGLVTLQGLQALGASYAIVPPADVTPQGAVATRVGR